MDDESRTPSSTPGGSGPIDETPKEGLVKRPAASRKSHRKTRTGCKTCKQRKIKCDENRPCNNCVKHSVKCDFLSHGMSSDRQFSQGFSNHGSPASNDIPTHGNLPGFERFASAALNGLQPAPLQLQDLELLHNFSNQTAMTLHNDPSIKTLLRTSIPQLGFKFEFVMRGVLAISALHLARFKHDQFDYYVSQALYHQDIALREASALIPNITEENCSAIYIFSVLTFYISLAKPRKAGDFFVVGEEGVADWLYLIKGTGYIMESSYDTLLKGPFGPLFEAGSRRHKLRVAAADTPPAHDPVAELQTLVHKNAGDLELLHVYDKAMEGLRKAFSMAYSVPGFETGDVFIWVFQVSDGYLSLLRQQTPESLCILGYFCVLLKLLDHYWWVEGWSVHLISKIYHVLDEEHRLWIRWPIEQIGWIPN